MAEFIKSLSIIIASLTAIYGINAWRLEFRGKKEYELAEEVLTLFFEARDKIRIIRSPFYSENEGTSRKPNTAETKEEKEIYDRAYVTSERYQREAGTFNKLLSLKYRFMALFGSDKAKPFDEVEDVLREILAAYQTIPFYRLQQGRVQMTEEELTRHLDEKHRFEGILLERHSKPDTIRERVDVLISEIEQTCSEVLRQDQHGFYILARFCRECIRKIRGAKGSGLNS